MSDAELIRRIATHWIDYGGDAEGVTWCWQALRDEVKRLELERQEGQP